MSKKFYPIASVRRIPATVLSSTEKLTLILLLDYLNCKEIFVSASRIAQDASLSIATVERSFRKFKRLKLMTTRKIRRGTTYLHVKSFDLELIKLLGYDFDSVDDDASVSREELAVNLSAF